MAFYDYECKRCGIIEVQQKISDLPLTHCPQCQEQNIDTEVKRLISTTSFILSGGGWSSSGYSK